MILWVNGEKKEFENNNMTVEEILKLNNVENTRLVAVQLNGEFVDSNNYSKVSLKNNDMIDFLYYMGGGE